MDKTELQKFIGNENLTVSEAMQKIDGNQLGILFIATLKGKLVGSGNRRRK